jgi:hypothetical protein
MRKEILVAVVLGILFGCLAAYGIWKAKAVISAKDAPSQVASDVVTPEEQNTATPTSITASVPSFSILEPQDMTVIAQNPFIISGTSTPDTFLLISSDENDYLTKTTQEGRFTQAVMLDIGVNQITITNFEKDGRKQVATRTVVYSNELVNSSDSGIKYQAYLGSVTDKTQESLQIKDSRSEIRFISVDPTKTTFVRINDDGQKEAVFDDVAIGDYIAALGVEGLNQVLDTRQIILTIPSGGLGNSAFQGKITESTRNEATLKVSDQTEFSVKPAKTVSVTSGDTQTKSVFSDLEEDQEVLVSGVQDGSTITARKIHIF